MAPLIHAPGQIKWNFHVDAIVFLLYDFSGFATHQSRRIMRLATLVITALGALLPFVGAQVDPEPETYKYEVRPYFTFYRGLSSPPLHLHGYA